MRVGYFTNQYPAPSHTFIRREISALEERGNRVSRYAIRRSQSALVDPDDLADAARTRHLVHAGALHVASSCLLAVLRNPSGVVRACAAANRFARAAGRSYLKHIFYLIEAMMLARWCADDRIEHLHVHFGTNAATVATIASHMGNTPFSFTVHGPEEFDRPQEFGLKQKIEAAAFVVAVSSFGRSQLMRWVPAGLWPKIHVVHCGVDDSYQDTPVCAPPPAKRLVSIGRFSEQKGQMMLVEAAARVRDSGLLFKLILVGDGSLRPDLERRIKSLMLDDIVIMTGWLAQDGVRKQIMSARALVLPSFAEGLPVALMESMALMRPAISTFIAGIPELLTPETGWLVPAGDIDKLAEAMREALTKSSGDLGEMGNAARRRVLERHDITKSAQLLEQHFLASARTKPVPTPAVRSIQDAPATPAL